MKRAMVIGLAIVLMLTGAAAAVVRSEPDGYQITAYFTKAIGLFGESDVKVLGVSVGKVIDVSPEGTRVKVVMQLHPDIKIPANATATIVPISLISDRYIQLSPPYTSGPHLKPGAVLSTSRTRIPAELDDVLGSLEKLFHALEAGREGDPGALADAIDNLAAALEGAGGDLDQTLGSTGEISRVINENSQQLDSLVVGLSRVLTALAERRDEIATLNRDLSTALGAVAEEQSSLAGTLTGLALLTEQVGSLIVAHRSDLEADITTLSKTTSAAVRQQESLVRNNDWLHVLGKGIEQSVDGKGAVHKQSNGLFHVDVRDTHGAATCPIPFIGCSLSPTFPASSPINPVAVTDEPALATDWSTPLSLPPLKLEPSRFQTVTTDEYATRPAGIVESFFTRLGDLISSLWGPR